MKKPAKTKPAKLKYRHITDREHCILRAWETVPTELWSSPDLFKKADGGNRMVHNKAYGLLMTGGVEALGFSIQRCFDFCLELIDQLDAAENAHLDSVEPILDLLQERGKICHYLFEPAEPDAADLYGRPARDKNEMILFKKEYNPHYYGMAIRQTGWIRKWAKRFGKRSFTSNEDQLVGYRSTTEKIGGQDFVLSENNWDNVDVYPEVSQYLKTSGELRRVQIDFWSMARASVALFDIDEETQKSMNFMPCRIQLGDKAFYLYVTKDDCDMMIDPILESSWSLDGSI